MGKLRTVLIDKNAVFLAGLRAVLQDTRFDVQDMADSIDNLAWQALAGHEHLLVVAGFGIDARDCADSLALLRSRLPTAKIMVLVERYSLIHLIATIHAGADGYQLKTIGSETLIKSLDLLVLGQPILPPLVVHDVGTIEGVRLPNSSNGSFTKVRSLSEREKEILGCLVQGSTNKAIARHLEITEQTVKVHVKAILRKIRVRNRTQAAIWAVDNFPTLESASAEGVPMAH